MIFLNPKLKKSQLKIWTNKPMMKTFKIITLISKNVFLKTWCTFTIFRTKNWSLHFNCTRFLKVGNFKRPISKKCSLIRKICASIPPNWSNDFTVLAFWVMTSSIHCHDIIIRTAVWWIIIIQLIHEIHERITERFILSTNTKLSEKFRNKVLSFTTRTWFVVDCLDKTRMCFWGIFAFQYFTFVSGAWFEKWRSTFARFELSNCFTSVWWIAVWTVATLEGNCCRCRRYFISDDDDDEKWRNDEKKCEELEHDDLKIESFSFVFFGNVF